MNKNKIDKYLKTSIIIVVSMMLGSLITIFLKDNNINTKNVTSSSYSEFDPLFEVYDYLNTKYYKKLNKTKLVDGAITGMLEATGDKHTNYLNKHEKEEFQEELSGEYFGIGVVIAKDKDKNVVIARVFPQSPAEKVGIKVGDILLKVDGKSIEKKSTSKIADSIKKGKSKKVKVTVKREDEEIEYDIEKENIELFTVTSEMLKKNNKKVGYIELSLFGEKTYPQFLDELNKLEKEEMDSLIIDLRGNSGGYLTTVTEMLSLFMDTNSIIYKVKTHEDIKAYKSLFPGKKDYKVVILIDKNSASASEIMASSMKESYGATLVGKTSYGKGSIQTTTTLQNKGLLKYTIQEWLTPNGNSIEGKGVDPDVDVDLDEDYNNDPTKENDNQLQKALEVASED